MISIRIAFAAAALAGFAAAPFALAQTPSAAEAIKARQAHYKELGKNFKGLRDELQKSDPAKADVQRYAKAIYDLSGQLPTWFPAGSGPESKLKTAAKAEIWTNNAEFKTLATNFATEAGKLNALAQKNDIAGVKGQVPALGGTCKACHEKFKAKDD